MYQLSHCVIFEISTIPMSSGLSLTSKQVLQSLRISALYHFHRSENSSSPLFIPFLPQLSNNPTKHSPEQPSAIGVFPQTNCSTLEITELGRVVPLIQQVNSSTNTQLTSRILPPYEIHRCGSASQDVLLYSDVVDVEYSENLLRLLSPDRLLSL